MKISLIVSTYNRPDALHLVLAGIAAQTWDKELAASEVEVIVADDGSREDTRQLVERWQQGFPVALRHVWHEDAGFRLAAIRNRSAAQAQGRWLIFIDGDCIPATDFLRRHWQLAQAGYALAGNRLLLAESFTQQVCRQGDSRFLHWPAVAWWRAWRRGDINKPFPWLRLPDGPWRKWRSGNWKIIKGCNIGVWKDDLVAINGFNEAFNGWGYEDSDFAVRILRLGRGLKDGRFAVPVLHLWHRENDRSQEPENRARLQAILQSTAIRADVGLDQYL